MRACSWLLPCCLALLAACATDDIEDLDPAGTNGGAKHDHDDQDGDQNRRPTQAELVAAAPNNPVYVQLGYGWAMLTPAAHQALNITSDADVPAGGKLERDASGKPTGGISGGQGATPIGRLGHIASCSLFDSHAYRHVGSGCWAVGAIERLLQCSVCSLAIA